MIAIAWILGIVALVWGGVFVFRGSLIGGCLAFLVAAACLGHSFLSFHLGPIPLTLDRLVLALVLLTYVVHRYWGRTDPKPITGIDLLLFGFTAALIISLVTADGSGNRLTPTAPVFRLIAGYLIPLILYWIARQAPIDRSKVTLVQGTLACMGVYLAVTGLLEISGQWWAVFPKHIANPDIGLHFGRARGPMVHAVSYGMYVGVCLLATWMWRERFGRVGRLIVLLLLPLMLAAVYFSYTRSVWMGTGLGLTILLALTLRGIWRPLVVGGMIAAALMLVTTRLDSIIKFEREYTGAYSGKSVELRGSFAYVSWKMFLDRPLMGVGFGQFPDAKLPYLSDRSTDMVLEDLRPFSHHNMFLSLLTETGAIGLGLFLALLAAWARLGWQLYRSKTAPQWVRAHGALLLAALALYICQVSFHELSYTQIEGSLIFFLAGMGVGLRPLALASSSPKAASDTPQLPWQHAAAS